MQGRVAHLDSNALAGGNRDLDGPFVVHSHGLLNDHVTRLLNSNILLDLLHLGNRAVDEDLFLDNFRSLDGLCLDDCVRHLDLDLQRGVPSVLSFMNVRYMTRQLTAAQTQIDRE